MPQGGCHLVSRAIRSGGILFALALCGSFSSGCERLASLAPAPTPAPPPRAPIAWGPWVLSPEPNRATVAWTTAEPVVGAVAFGASASLDGIARESEARRDHRVVLTSLSPLTRYRYRVEAEVPAEGSFSTAPDPRAPVDAKFRVLVYGDNRGSAGDHELVARAASAEDAQLALHTGDMVANATDPEPWARWFETERDLLSHLAFVPTVGNHELADKGVAYAAHFLDKGKPAYKAVDYGPLHILVLDSFEQPAGADPHEAAISDAQRAWAQADVKALEPGRHLWVLVHQGPFSHPQQPRPGHGGSEVVQRVVSSLQRLYPVEAVFAGHEDFYERGLIDGLNFFVVGGGGAPLEEPDASFPSVQAARKTLSYAVLDVCGCHVTGKAKDIFGNVFDSFTLSDCPRPCGAQPSSAASAAPVGGVGPSGAGGASRAGKPAAAPEHARAIAPDPSRAVAPDPIRTVAPDPVRVVEPDPLGPSRAAPSGAPESGQDGGEPATSSRSRRQRRRASGESAE
jgi:acid phosphatase type 7